MPSIASGALGEKPAGSVASVPVQSGTNSHLES